MSNLKDLGRDACPPPATPISAEQVQDAELREVVLKFEELYAELAPPVEKENPARSGDIFKDFPSEWSSAHESAPGLAPMKREGLPVDPVLSRKSPADAIESGPKKSSTPVENLDIVEAMSMLRAAEASGKAAAADRAAREAQVDADLAKPLPSVMAVPAVQGTRVALATPVPRVVEPAAAQEDQPTRSGTSWSVVLVASSLTLLVGAGVGYLVSRDHDPMLVSTPVSKIETSAEGGAILRPDYELSRR